MSLAIESVLGSVELFTLITSFQDGLFICLLPLGTTRKPSKKWTKCQINFLTNPNQLTPFYLINRLLQCRPSLISTTFLTNLAHEGQVELLRYLSKHPLTAAIPLDSTLIDQVVCRGNIQTIQYLCEEQGQSNSSGTMICAAHYGYIDIIKYLYSKGQICTPEAITKAFQSGHIDVHKSSFRHAIVRLPSVQLVQARIWLNAIVSMGSFCLQYTRLSCLCWELSHIIVPKCSNRFSKQIMDDGIDCDDFEKTLKVIVLGNGNVGKTSLTTQYAKGRFTSNYKKTIGVDFMERTVHIDGEDVHLMIWDTAGQEEFDTLTSRYYKGAGAAIYVFSTVDRDSFEALPNWQKKVLDECGPLCQVLVQNKMDLIDQAAMSKKEVDEMKQDLNVRLFRASVQENVNVDAIFDYICRRYLKKLAGNEPDAVADISTLTTESDSRHSSKRSLDERKPSKIAKENEKEKISLPPEREEFSSVLMSEPPLQHNTNNVPTQPLPVVPSKRRTNGKKTRNDAYVALEHMQNAKFIAKEARNMAWEDYYSRRWNELDHALEIKAAKNLAMQIEALSKHQATSNNFELWNTALDQRYYEYIKYQLRENAEIPKSMLLTNISNEDLTPLVKACTMSDLKMLKILLDAGADSTVKYPNHENPYMRSIYQAALKDVQIFELLLKHSKVSIAEELCYIDSNGKSLVHLAAEGGHLNVLSLLLNHPTTKHLVKLQTPQKQTALHLAVLGSYTRCVKVLLKVMEPEAIASCDSSGNNVLHLALNPSETRFHLNDLIDTFFTPECPKELFESIDANGCAALHLAIIQNLEGIALKLIHHGKTPLNTCNKEGLTALHMAVAMQNHTLIKALMEANVMIDVVDDIGQTPLLLASLVGDTTTIKLLLDAGADAACQNREGHTSLHYAATYCHDENAFRLLIKKGAGVNAKSAKGNIPLHFAAMKGNHVAARMLLEYGADMSILNEDKRTVVFLARQWGHIELETYFNDLLKEDVALPIPPLSLEMAGSIATKLLRKSKEAKVQVQINRATRSPNRIGKGVLRGLDPLTLSTPNQSVEDNSNEMTPITLDSVLESIIDTDWEHQSISGDSTLSQPFQPPLPNHLCMTPFVKRQLANKELRHDMQELLRYSQPLKPLREHIKARSMVQKPGGVHIPWHLTVPVGGLTLERRFKPSTKHQLHPHYQEPRSISDVRAELAYARQFYWEESSVKRRSRHDLHPITR
ncbi:ras family GTPase [Thraustotheca clavata]|uniref:Ras family GTPase n=1 Tax=Thraustotheca clavata TaxID=74557 RepID=A0A1V9ZJ29_9STRA|nr:ras family GTPase [Thraustotheca clavata]